MILNRSVPTDTILPHLAYRDVPEAIAWLTHAFGFSEHYRYGEPVSGAQMHLGNAWIMLNTSQPGPDTQNLTVFVEDVGAHYQKTKSSGAKIVEDLHETIYGELQYGVKDLAGHHWLFSQHARDVSPNEWGATVSQPATLPAQVSPMLAVSDGDAAITFYQAAFDANVRWHFEGGGQVIAGLAIDGAQFFLAHESPSYGQRGPASVGFTTVRIELFVDDPVAVQGKALAAGAVELSPVIEYEHSMTGPYPIKRMLQGALVDPFGHMWLVGKILA